jgi:hypothetical protein
MAGFAHALVVCLAASAAKTSVAGASREDKVFELALASGRIKQGPRSPNPPRAILAKASRQHPQMRSKKAELPRPVATPWTRTVRSHGLFSKAEPRTSYSPVRHDFMKRRPPRSPLSALAVEPDPPPSASAEPFRVAVSPFFGLLRAGQPGYVHSFGPVVQVCGRGVCPDTSIFEQLADNTTPPSADVGAGTCQSETETLDYEATLGPAGPSGEALNLTEAQPDAEHEAARQRWLAKIFVRAEEERMLYMAEVLGVVP